MGRPMPSSWRSSPPPWGWSNPPSISCGARAGGRSWSKCRGSARRTFARDFPSNLIRFGRAMEGRPFEKYEGLGNDFIVVDHEIDAAEARALCDRRRGIGADGVLVVLPPREAR